MGSPSKFAHVVYKTHRFGEMIDWYQRVFDAKVQNRTEHLAFLTYDEEHHRFAFVNLGPGEAKNGSEPPATPGVHHVAYTWDTLPDLMDQYRKMRELDVKPHTCLRHGPTLSMYFADPDGNSMEFQVDLLSVEDANGFLQSDAFNANPIGEGWNPDELLEAMDSGQPLEERVLRSDQRVPESGLAVPLT